MVLYGYCENPECNGEGDFTFDFSTNPKTGVCDMCEKPCRVEEYDD